MYYPQVEENFNTRSMISAWYGYNHNYRINDGEFYDMENLTTDAFPVMSAREKRATLKKAEFTYRGLLYTDENLAFLDGNIFHYGSRSIDLTDLITGERHEVSSIDERSEGEPGTSEQTLIRFGTYILIYPLNIWVSVIDNEDLKAGKMDASYTVPDDMTITYTISTADGSSFDNLTVSEDEPEDPKQGDYWLCTKEGALGLNIRTKDSWQPVATTYLRIDIPGYDLTTLFSKGDVVNMTSHVVDNINNGSVIQEVGTDFIVVIGLMDEAQKEETTSRGRTFTISRDLPILDYVCADKNRVWGCRYGRDRQGNFVNEIYCTKLGDFKNWYVYEGLTTDSYAVSVGVPGEWTGCISYGGYPTFFKENAIFRIYGSYPAEYTVINTDARGVQAGSSKSLAIINETLYYKAPGSVMAYDGARPTPISQAFGKNVYYYDGCAGVGGSKYYLEVTNTYGGHVLFVYDTDTGLWMKESQIKAVRFAWQVDGRLFAASEDYIYGLGLTDSVLYASKLVGEEFVTWSATTGEMGYDYADFKYVNKLTLRAYVPTKSEINVEISYDDKPFEPVNTLRGNDEIMSQTLDIYPFRCDHYKLRFSGHGPVMIYTLAITLDTGSEEYGYKN